MSENNANSIPEYPRTVLVPVANPSTVSPLLELAAALVDPEEGRVIALIVTLGDDEANAKTIDAITPIVEELQRREAPVELLINGATSIARGILDAAREHSADLLIIGLRQPSHGQVVLGPVTENVVATAPCDVLVYRAASAVDFKRIVVWANGSQPSRVACQTSILLGRRYATPVEAVAVQSRGRRYWRGRARIEQSLDGIPGQQLVKRSVITAGDTLNGILTRIHEDDLLVVGFSGGGDLERWLFGDFSRRLLDRAPGPVLLSARSAGQATLGGRMRRRLGWVQPTLTTVEQDELVRRAEEMAAPHLDYIVLIVISAFLAAFGLLQNSNAVIIGAMLVAPLMQPLIAFSTGLTTGRVSLIRQGLVTGLQGILIALLIAVITGRLIPSLTPTEEMLARGNPSLLDAGVALVSGLAGAWATARKDIPAALAGVAIAAALMPPLVTVGLGIALQDADLFAGAALLFITNLIFISLAGWAVFFWLGMRPRLVDESRQRQYISLALVAFLGVVVVGMLLNLRSQQVDVRAIESALENQFSATEIITVAIIEREPLHVVATLRSVRNPGLTAVGAAQEALALALEEPVELEVIFQRIIRPPEDDTDDD